MPYNHFLSRVYLYAMEGILLYVVLVVFYFHTTSIPPLFPFLFITVIGGITFAFVLSVMKSNTPYIFIMLFIPVLAYIASILGISFGLSIFLSGMICWRIVGHFKNDTIISDFLLILLTLGIGFLIYLGAVVQSYLYQEIILYLIIGQLLLMMVGKVLKGFVTSTLLEKEKYMTKHSFSTISVFGLLALGSIILALSLPFIVKNVLSFLFSIASKVLYVASVPFFNTVENAEFKRNNKGQEEDGVGWAGALDDLKPLENQFLANINIWTVLSVIAFAILAILLVILAKRRLILEPEETNIHNGYQVSFDHIKQPLERLKREQKTPVEKIRRLIFELELLSARKARGRYEFETVSEWLTRNQFLNTRLVQAYEKVRYGNESLSDNEIRECDEIVKQLKTELRLLRRS